MVFCKCCGKPIKHPIKDDWKNRTMHKKCWKDICMPIQFDHKTGKLLTFEERMKYLTK